MELNRQDRPVVTRASVSDQKGGGASEAGQKRKRPWNVVRQGGYSFGE